MEQRPAVLNGEPIPYESSVSHLRKSLETPGPKAWAACIALGNHPSDEAFFILQGLLDHPDWRYRRSAVEAMHYHIRGATVSDRIIGCLHDPSPYVVREALRTINRLGLVRAHDGIMDLTASEDSHMRETAVMALKGISVPEDFEQLLKRYKNDSSIEVRKALAWLLRDLASADNWKELFSLWKDDAIPRHRVWACELAGMNAADSEMMELRRLANDTNGHVSKAALKALEHL